MSAYGDAATIMQGLAALLAAGAGAFGVRQYRIATAAEARLKHSAEVENELKIAAHFAEVMKIAEGWGEIRDGAPAPVGLASQRAAIRSIVRLVALHPELHEAAERGLTTLSETAGLDRLYNDLDLAITQIKGYAELASILRLRHLR